MKFLLLLYHDEKQFAARPQAEQQALLDEAIGVAHELAAGGRYFGASPLGPAAAGAVVRVRDGRRLVTDGPFIETKEQIGGYFLIDAPGMEDAVAIAERMPAVRFGTVEIRPLKEISGLPEIGLGR